MIKKLIVSSLLFISMSANAEFLSGNKLYSFMTGNVEEKSFALGYVAGVADTLTGTSFCPQGEVTLGQIRDIIRNSLEKLPEYRNKTADSIIYATLSTWMPCKSKTTQQPERRT
jgi:hypothetical protein